MRTRERESRGDGRKGWGQGKREKTERERQREKERWRGTKGERKQTDTEGGDKDTKRDTPTCVELHVSTANLTLQRNHLRVRLHQDRVWMIVAHGGFRKGCHRYERCDLKRPSNQH